MRGGASHVSSSPVRHDVAAKRLPWLFSCRGAAGPRRKFDIETCVRQMDALKGTGRRVPGMACARPGSRVNYYSRGRDHMRLV